MTYFILLSVCSDDRLPLVLWGKFATDVDNAIQLRRENQKVLVLRFGKIKVWKGLIYLFYFFQFFK